MTNALQTDVLLKRQEAQQYLLHYLSYIPETTGAAAASFRLTRMSSLTPTVALLDLLRCAWQLEKLLEFNPFLSAAACSRLYKGLLLWLQLCVLEDKLARLTQQLQAGAEASTVLVQVGVLSIRHLIACTWVQLLAASSTLCTQYKLLTALN